MLRGGKLVDGTGAPWRQADVGIVDDYIKVVGTVSGSAGTREIDILGLVIAPGFIDIHSHSDQLLLEDELRSENSTKVLRRRYWVKVRLPGPNRGTAAAASASSGQWVLPP